MAQVKELGAAGLFTVAAFITVRMEGQAGNPSTLIQQKLVPQIKVPNTCGKDTTVTLANGKVSTVQQCVRASGTMRGPEKE